MGYDAGTCFCTNVSLRIGQSKLKWKFLQIKLNGKASEGSTESVPFHNFCKMKYSWADLEFGRELNHRDFPNFPRTHHRKWTWGGWTSGISRKFQKVLVFLQSKTWFSMVFDNFGHAFHEQGCQQFLECFSMFSRSFLTFFKVPHGKIQGFSRSHC